VQQEYLQLYGGPDSAPIDATEFLAPNGYFVIGYVDGDPAAMGGWRRHSDDHPETRWAGRRAEVKRMYVRARYRRYGLARLLLTDLEQSARTAGCDWLLLETGRLQPAAIQLYRSAGFDEVAPFGHYLRSPLSVHLGKRLR
jgi:ribosomal protein S18 acetylase RimI-like enzyme